MKRKSNCRKFVIEFLVVLVVNCGVGVEVDYSDYFRF